MDRIPTTLPNSVSRLIAMAAMLIGSDDPVREAMQASVDDFRAYQSGAKEPPWPEMDRLIDLIVREQKKMIERNRAAVRETRENLTQQQDESSE